MNKTANPNRVSKFFDSTSCRYQNRRSLPLGRVRTYIDAWNRTHPDKSVNLLLVREDMEILMRVGKKHRDAKYTVIRIEELYAIRKRLKSMGITNDEEFRAVLREFIPHINGTGKSEEQKRLERIKLRQSELVQAKTDC